MRDMFGRTIDYLRVSVTDRCNFRCIYCMPHDFEPIPHDEILRYEEILRLCGIMAKLGIRNIRLTGGEPLTRRGCVSFIEELKALPGIEKVTLTTNAAFLEPHIKTLAKVKIDGLNISLDSLNGEIFKKITGSDKLDSVLKALNSAIAAGIYVKVNMVPMAGVNDNEIGTFAEMAESVPVFIRFIELMPTAVNAQAAHFSSEKILAVLREKYPDLTPDDTKHGSGPARYFKSEKLIGGIALIDAVSNHFCEKCNRLRLTSDGFLKLCLYHGEGLNLKEMHRGGASDGEIESAIKQAVLNKPERHAFESEEARTSGIGKMSQIGG